MENNKFSGLLIKIPIKLRNYTEKIFFQDCNSKLIFSVLFMSNNLIFHLAIPINNIELAKKFYRDGLGCQVGRENDKAIIFNFSGHQLVAHMTKEPLQPQKGIYPRHFGIVYPTLAAWQELVDRVQNYGLSFHQQPRQRFPNQITEHWVFFLEDPFYNLLEFKHYSNPESIFEPVTATIGDR